MKNIKPLVGFLKAVALAMLCITLTQLNGAVVFDFTSKDLGGSSITITKPTITCDVNKSWTCTFVGTATPDTDTYRYIANVAVAHINLDGSIYLQEIDITKEDVSDNWSVTLPAWYVSNGLTSYSLVGTDCTFTIKPTTSAGSVTDWALTVRGKATVTSGKDKDGKTTTTTTNTCGGDTAQTGGKGKSGKEKTGTSTKGPGPK